MSKERFEKFVEGIIADGDWEYDSGDPMVEDAKEFLRWYQMLNQLWSVMMDAFVKAVI